MREDYYYWLSAWLAYVDKCQTSYIPRSGTIACGLTDELKYNGYDVYRKAELVSEHEGRSSYLYNLLKIWEAYAKLPDVFGGDTGVKKTPQDGWLESQINPLASLFLQIHDTGESILGDQLDDGSEDHLHARQIEFDVMENHFLHYPAAVANKLRLFYQLFESYGMADIPDDFDKSLIREAAFAKIVEKADAIGYQLFLGTKGLTGDITYKKSPSKRDLYYVGLLGTKRAVDIYTLHLRIISKHLDPELICPVIGFLKAGFKDAFQEIPSCLTIDVTDLDLDPPENLQ